MVKAQGMDAKNKTGQANAANKTKDNNSILFSWTAQDSNNRTVKGETRSKSKAVLSATLRRQGLLLKQAKEVQLKRFSNKISGKDIAIFTRQLATLTRAGVPMLRAFDLLSRGTSNPALANVIQKIRSDVEEGIPLNKAFAGFPLLFDDLYCNLVAAGEQAGILDTLLERLALYREKSMTVQAKVKSALTYPVIIMTIAGAVISVIMIYVIPSFKQIFTNSGGTLPLPTQIVINISEFFVHNIVWMIGTLVIGIPIFLKAYRKNKSWQNAVDLVLLKIPVIGDILKKASIARWTRTLSTMSSAGVPIIQALGPVGSASGNWLFQKTTQAIRTQVAEGIALAIAMEESHVFPPMVTQMVSIGEESGSLELMLGKVADFYEEEVDEAVGALSTIIEPILIAFLGIVVGGIIIAMYLPIFKMGGGGG